MVGIDTNVFIYTLEKNPSFYAAASKALTSAAQSGEEVCVPALVFTELLSGTGDKALLNFFEAQTFKLYEMTREIAMLAGMLRFSHKTLRTADAVHIATALTAGADRFITNDNRLYKLNVGLRIVPLSSFNA